MSADQWTYSAGCDAIPASPTSPREERQVAEADPVVVDWRKSTYSGSGDCVEWRIEPAVIRVRDSKNPGGPELRFTQAEWDAFVSGVKAGQADRP